MTTAEVTTAAEFRTHRLEGEVVTLPPTGRVVRMKAVKPAELLALGDIPEPLAELVIAFLYGNLSEDQYADFFSPKEKREQALDLIKSLEIVATCALLEPSIADSGYEGPDAIAVDDLEDSELRYIFDLAMMGASHLHEFRLEQEAPVEPVADGQEPIPTTLDPGQRDGPVDGLSD